MERGCRASVPTSGSRTGASRRSEGCARAMPPKMIDAQVMIVAPGFVDLHTHYDAQLFWDPYCSISSWHGVTSIVIGNCGFGFAPVKPRIRERAMLTMTRIEAIPYASMKAGDAVGLGHLSRVPRQHRSPAQGGEYAALRAVSPLLDLCDGSGGGEDRGRRPSRKNARCAACWTRRWMPAHADGPRSGWIPKGPACVQRDYDGTPMVSDVMTDDTCYALARVLGAPQRGLHADDAGERRSGQDLKHFEKLAEISGRPILFNVVQPRDRCRLSIAATSRGWRDAARTGCASTGRRSPATPGMSFTFKDWNLFDEFRPGARRPPAPPRSASEKLGDPRRREALQDRRCRA